MDRDVPLTRILTLAVQGDNLPNTFLTNLNLIQNSGRCIIFHFPHNNCNKILILDQGYTVVLRHMASVKMHKIVAIEFDKQFYGPIGRKFLIMNRNL